MFRWIAFDAVGTLIRPQPDVATVYTATARRHGSRLTADEVHTRFRKTFAESTAACLPLREGNILTSEELELRRWKWIVERVLDDVSDPEACFRELYDYFRRPEHWRVFDDVSPTFDQLRRRGLRLALASNFDRRLHDLCQGLPPLSLIERRVVSTEVGWCKPSPRFFEALLQACCCQPDELLMVGDDLEADLAGPKRAGLSAVLLDRQGTTAGPDLIRSLCELPARIGSN